MDGQYISLDGDPDDVAARLLAPHLLRSSLDGIDVDSDEGVGQLLAHLIKRMGRASIEKDELIRFAQLNRRALEGGRLEMITAFAEAAKATDEGFGGYFEYFSDNLKLALAGKTAEMDMRSDKLFWLVYALSHQLASGKITHARALAKLSRPEVVARMSRHQLFYMLHDYVESIETPQQPSVTLLVLVGECALLARETAIVRMTAALLAKLRDNEHRSLMVSFVSRALGALPRESDVAEIESSLSAWQSKGKRIAEDDF